MNQQQWNEGLNHIDPDLLENYLAKKKQYANKDRSTTSLLYITAVACCLCLTILSLVLVPMFKSRLQPQDMPPALQDNTSSTGSTTDPINPTDSTTITTEDPTDPTNDPIDPTDTQVVPTESIDVPSAPKPTGPLQPSEPTGQFNPHLITFNLYAPNEEGDGFRQFEVTIEELNSHLILQSLQSVGVISQEVAIISVTVDGNNMLILNMNESFLVQLDSLDSTDEEILMRCLVNTFLSAFDFCECMMVIAEGEVIHTDNANYDSPMYKTI